MGIQIVMALMKPILNLGYCLTTDDFYTSPILADILLRHKTDLFWTLKSNRKEVPNDLQKKKLKKREMVAYERGKVCVMKWKDTKGVALLSTIHKPEIIEIQPTRDSKKIPKVVHGYNNSMGGVDRIDQHLTN
ncbi:Transposase IS4 [Popillia japonica]|uniref:Transposase IS4 n=1 Tax=Popillia japonica TaxID=7064 RepID=A0AAW1MXC3_POPJA